MVHSCSSRPATGGYGERRARGNRPIAPLAGARSTACKGIRDAIHDRKPPRRLRVPGASASRAWDPDDAEHGPRHALGLGRRHGVRKRFVVGHSRWLRVRRAGAPVRLEIGDRFGGPGRPTASGGRAHRPTGKRRKPRRGGPKYEFPLHPQQIVTIRLRTAKPAPDVKLITEWDEFVSKPKLPALHAYSALNGHPPRGQ